MKCPLRVMTTGKVKHLRDSEPTIETITTVEDCIEAECGWWNYDTSGCAMVSVGAIPVSLLFIRKHWEKIEQDKAEEGRIAEYRKATSRADPEYKQWLKDREEQKLKGN